MARMDNNVPPGGHRWGTAVTATADAITAKSASVVWVEKSMVCVLR